MVSASVGSFDVDTLNVLSAVYEQASDLLSKDSDAFMPVLTEVRLDLGSDEVQALVAADRTLGAERAMEPLGD